MALMIRPTDVLMNRLLQQNSRATETPQKKQVHHHASVSDQVSISSAAKKNMGHGNPPAQTYATSGHTAQLKQEELESRLLRLYSGHHESTEKEQ